MRSGTYLKILGGLLILAALGCKNSAKESSVVGILPREKFTQLLFDLHLADSWYAHRRAQGEDPKTVALGLYDSVFALHGITRKQFEESMVWYAAHPQVLDKIYDELIHQINVMQATSATADTLVSPTQESEQH